MFIYDTRVRFIPEIAEKYLLKDVYTVESVNKWGVRLQELIFKDLDIPISHLKIVE
jgi:hypothetical protein